MRRKRPAHLSSDQLQTALARREKSAKRDRQEPFAVLLCRDGSAWEGTRRVWAESEEEAFTLAQGELRSDEYIGGIRPVWGSRV